MYDTADISHNGCLEVGEFKQFILFVLDAMGKFLICETGDDIAHMFESFKNHALDGCLTWEQIWKYTSPCLM